MKAYNFRFDESDVNTWKAEAEKAGQSLSAWIRGCIRRVTHPITYDSPPPQSLRELSADVLKLAKIKIGGVEVQFCEHGATAYNCKKWGCKFYDIANGRK